MIVPAVDGYFRIQRRLRTGRDHEVLPFQFRVTIPVLHAKVVRIQELSESVEDVYAVPSKLVLRDRNFILDHPLHAKIQVRHRHVFFYVVIRPVEVLRIKPRQMQNGFAHRLARNRPGIDAHAADRGALFDDRDALSSLRSLDGGALPARSGANHDQVIRLHSTSPTSLLLRGRRLAGFSSPQKYKRRTGFAARECVEGRSFHRPAA